MDHGQRPSALLPCRQRWGFQLPISPQHFCRIYAAGGPAFQHLVSIHHFARHASTRFRRNCFRSNLCDVEYPCFYATSLYSQHMGSYLGISPSCCRFNPPAAATASGGVLLAGYIADRYLADFLPFLVLASAIALVDLFRRAAKRSRRLRVLLLVSIVVTGAFCVAANIGASLESLNIWTSAQAIRFVEAQRSLSLEPLASTVARGPVLPYWAPTGQIFDVNDCGGLYLSSGVDYHTSPGQNLQHLTWTPMEQAGGINHAITMTLTQPAGELRSVIPILRHGRTTVLLEPSGAQTLQVAVIHAGNAPSWPPSVSPPFVVQPHRLITIMVMTDPYMHSIEVRYQQVQGGFEGLATHKPAV